MIVKCKPTMEGKTPCPMIQTCLARMTDETITGCGLPLAYAGIIKWQDIQVEHTIRKEEEEDEWKDD